MTEFASIEGPFRDRDEQKIQCMRTQDLFNNLLPLPLRCIPNKWESLDSVVSRVSRKMGYEHPSWILQPQRSAYRIASHHLSMLYQDSDYLFLEHMLLLDAETLYLQTLHRFTDRLKPRSNDRFFFDKADQSFFVAPIGTTKVCPFCLDESDGYDRIYWQFEIFNFCPCHGCALVDRCPACGFAIPALRTSLAKCPKCRHGDYRFARYFRIAPQAFLSVSTQLSLYMLGIDDPGILNLPPHFPPHFATSPVLSISPRQYLELFHLFGYITRYLCRQDALTLVATKLPLPEVQALSTEHPSLGNVLQSILFHYMLAHWPFQLINTLDVLYEVLVKVYRHNGEYGVYYGIDMFEGIWDSQRMDLADDFSRLHSVINTFADLFYQSGWRLEYSELLLFAVEHMSKARTHNGDEKN